MRRGTSLTAIDKSEHFLSEPTVEYNIGSGLDILDSIERMDRTYFQRAEVLFEVDPPRSEGYIQSFTETDRGIAYPISSNVSEIIESYHLDPESFEVTLKYLGTSGEIYVLRCNVDIESNTVSTVAIDVDGRPRINIDVAQDGFHQEEWVRGTFK